MDIGILIICIITQFVIIRSDKGILKYGEDFKSTAGISSELDSWTVTVIMIFLMAGVASIVVIVLHCKAILSKRKHAKITVEENTEMDKQIAVGIKVPINHNRKMTLPPITASGTNKQQDVGYHSKGSIIKPLPPIVTSVFVIDLPKREQRIEQYV